MDFFYDQERSRTKMWPTLRVRWIQSGTWTLSTRNCDWKMKSTWAATWRSWREPYCAVETKSWSQNMWVHKKIDQWRSVWCFSATLTFTLIPRSFTIRFTIVRPSMPRSSQVVLLVTFPDQNFTSMPRFSLAC